MPRQLNNFIPRGFIDVKAQKGYVSVNKLND